MSVYGPGSFESFKRRSDNQGLNERQLQLKYEQELFQSQQLMELIYDQQQAAREQQIQHQVQHSSNLSGQIEKKVEVPVIEVPDGFVKIYEVSPSGLTSSLGSTSVGVEYDGTQWTLGIGFLGYGGDKIGLDGGGNYYESGDVLLIADDGTELRLNANNDYTLFPFVDAITDTELNVFYFDDLNPETPEPSWVPIARDFYSRLESGDITTVNIYINDDNPNYFVDTY